MTLLQSVVGFSLILSKAVAPQSRVMLEMVKWLCDGISRARSFGWVLIPLNPCLGFEFGAAHPRPAQRTLCHGQNPGLAKLLFMDSRTAQSSQPEQPSTPPATPTELLLSGNPNATASFGTQIISLSVQPHILLMVVKMLINFNDCSFLRQVRKLDPQLSVRPLV